MNVQDATYLAGFFDGEGTVGLRHAHRTRNIDGKDSFTLRIRITQTNEDVMNWVKIITGTGTVYKKKTAPGFKDAWEWATSGTMAVQVLREMYPFLKVKRLQAEIAFKFGDTIKPKRGNPLSIEERQYRYSLRKEMDVANRSKLCGSSEYV